MNHRVIASHTLSPNVRKLVIDAPHVVRHCKPGQFVIVRVNADSERIPLTIADSDADSQRITLIVQAIGASTTQLCALDAGDTIRDIAGPLGKPTHLENVGHAVIVGGGVGTAVIYPQAYALKSHGNQVSAIIGGRTADLVILETELRAACDDVYPCTDDGSHGYHGFVTDRLQKLIDDSRETSPVGMVICAGPVPMMRAVAEVTRPPGIPTIASLNPIMVDGTGMCGGCRVQVGNEMKFACVDGPEFDAHLVDFKELADRLTAYRDQEAEVSQRHCQAETQL